MTKLLVTVDIDWACEAAIAQTLEFLLALDIKPTVFVTHHSPYIDSLMNQLDVGLHPYFNPQSSHGATIAEVATHIMSLPHNTPIFRFHRFAGCNASKKAMADAGMTISSNVCSDLEVVTPFRERSGLWEMPIFLEDGGYLWRQHPLEIFPELQQKVLGPGTKVIIIHPMHFVVNTPHFAFMYDIKQAHTREQWNCMNTAALNKLRWPGRGIRDLITDLIQLAPSTPSLKELLDAI